MAKLPSWQFYPGDWKKDPGVQSLTYEDRGVWFELLLLMFESEERGRLLLNGKPFPMDALARILHLDKQSLTKKFATFLESGIASIDEEGALINRRMIRDENLRKIRAECGKLGGNPSLLNQKSNQTPNQKPTTRVNQKSTPSSSSSSSTSVVLKTPPLDGVGKKETEAAAEKKKNGWAIWIDVNRELGRKDPVAFGPELAAAKNILKALKEDQEKTAGVMRSFLKDQDAFLVNNGHSLTLLPKRMAKYVNGIRPVSRVPSNHNLSGKKYVEVIPDELNLTHQR